LTPKDQQAVVDLINSGQLNDPPPSNVAAHAISPMIDVTWGTATSATTSVTPLSEWSVHSNVWWNWSVLGISYSRVDLDYYYVTDSVSVLYDFACTSSYSNAVPFRSISHSEEHWVWSGTGTCLSNYTIVKDYFWTTSGQFGMTVNGDHITSTWQP